MSKFNVRSATCVIHNKSMQLVRNPRGGMFWSCPHEDCMFTVSPENGHTSNDPRVVGRASTRRSRCTSKRSELKAKLVANGFDESGAEEFLNAEGIAGAERLLTNA